MFENGTFAVLGPDGKQVQCDVLFTYDCEDNGRSYVVFTTGEGAQQQLFANRFAAREDGSPRSSRSKTSRSMPSSGTALKSSRQSSPSRPPHRRVKPKHDRSFPAADGAGHSAPDTLFFRARHAPVQ